MHKNFAEVRLYGFRDMRQTDNLAFWMGAKYSGEYVYYLSVCLSVCSPSNKLVINRYRSTLGVYVY